MTKFSFLDALGVELIPDKKNLTVFGQAIPKKDTAKLRRTFSQASGWGDELEEDFVDLISNPSRVNIDINPQRPQINYLGFDFSLDKPEGPFDFFTIAESLKETLAQLVQLKAPFRIKDDATDRIQQYVTATIELENVLTTFADKKVTEKMDYGRNFFLPFLYSAFDHEDPQAQPNPAMYNDAFSRRSWDKFKDKKGNDTKGLYSLPLAPYSHSENINTLDNNLHIADYLFACHAMTLFLKALNNWKSFDKKPLPSVIPKLLIKPTIKGLVIQLAKRLYEFETRHQDKLQALHQALTQPKQTQEVAPETVNAKPSISEGPSTAKAATAMAEQPTATETLTQRKPEDHIQHHESIPVTPTPTPKNINSILPKPSYAKIVQSRKRRKRHTPHKPLPSQPKQESNKIIPELPKPPTSKQTKRYAAKDLEALLLLSSVIFAGLAIGVASKTLIPTTIIFSALAVTCFSVGLLLRKSNKVRKMASASSSDSTASDESHDQITTPRPKIINAATNKTKLPDGVGVPVPAPVNKKRRRKK